MQRLPQNQTTPTECVTMTSSTSSTHCCPRPVIEKTPDMNPRSKAELAVVSNISPSMLALKRQIIHQREVRQKSSGANKNCDTSSVTWRHYLAHAVGKKTADPDLGLASPCDGNNTHMNLDQKQNWLLSVASSPSVLGLGRQFCHHAEVAT